MHLWAFLCPQWEALIAKLRLSSSQSSLLHAHRWAGEKADLEAAKELYGFICKNVELPDVRPNPADGLVEFAKEYIEKLTKDKGVDLWVPTTTTATPW